MSLSTFIKQNEKVFKGSQDIKYFFWPSEKPSKNLVVIFSGFNGSEAKGVPATYNYIKPMSKIDCNRLFILDDYRGHPCYYLGENKKLDYEVSVISLIYRIANKLNIPPENIITCGSSKGGTAALYLGLKYQFGHIVTGGFQIKVGDYLHSVHNYGRDKVLKLITGGSTGLYKEYLNEFYLDFINNVKVKDTSLYIHGGKGDSHYLEHVTIFNETMNKRNIPYNLDIQNYSSHAEIGPHFVEFILDKIPEITRTLLIKDTFITKTQNNEIKVSCTVNDRKSTIQYAYYIYKEGKTEPVDKIMYTSDTSIIYKIKEPGKYRVRIFARRGDQKVALGTSSVSF
ncbi:hypothetical protein [Sediminibacillus albus]|uniref:Two component regulator three Y domain-containing protein n=1 Tax=Sediminibacillus albus TaxID=407036 RepID=A0A1G8X693_9BACI|nr:hypothetical protein [Sediminibacillus albus]SDJ86063.1 hypothetical protein SAMN05216243_1184 [Sediminibacillus albus]